MRVIDRASVAQASGRPRAIDHHAQARIQTLGDLRADRVSDDQGRAHHLAQRGEMLDVMRMRRERYVHDIDSRAVCASDGVSISYHARPLMSDAATMPPASIVACRTHSTEADGPSWTLTAAASATYRCSASRGT